MRLKPTALLTGPYDWDPALVPAREFDERLASVRRLLAQQEVSALLVHGNSSEHGALAYLTAFAPKLGPAFALVGPGGSVRLLVSGSPAMLPAAKRLTWIEDVRPLGDLKASLAAWLSEKFQEAEIAMGLWGQGFMTLRPYNAISAAVEDRRARIIELTAGLEALRLNKSHLEHELARRASSILGKAICELTHAFASGAGTRVAALAAERAAYRLGAQDARALAGSRNGGSPVVLDTHDNSPVSPLLVYVAVRFAGYWTEGFATFSKTASDALVKAQNGLAAMLQTARGGVSFAELASIARQHVRPYRLHPLVERAIGNSVGLSIEEPCEPALMRSDTLQPGGIYALRSGVAGEAPDHAIVSAMIRVHEAGIEVLWSALENARETAPAGTPL